MVPDSTQLNQFRALSLAAEFGDGLLCRSDRHDLVVERMYCQYGQPPFADRCWRPSGNRDYCGEPIGIFHSEMPCAGAAHTEPCDGNLRLVDVEVLKSIFEQQVHGAVVRGTAPAASLRIRRHDYGAKPRKRLRHEHLEQRAACSIGTS